GQVWPGQQMELEIEDPYDEHTAAEGPDGATWNTTLRLTLPHLGAVEARLALDGAGLKIRLAADSDAAVGTLNRDRATLAKALAAADIAVRDLQVSRNDERQH
ncbi:MAG: flagellar hook-length control protein FliK, partial [Rhodocyclaceae bacterium]|nr:flagellar hook-length control protein FliK [Rhodocyclaceae bacterium]